MAYRAFQNLGRGVQVSAARIAALVPLQGFMTNRGSMEAFVLSAIREILPDTDQFLGMHFTDTATAGPLVWPCQRQGDDGNNNLFSPCLLDSLHRLLYRTTFFCSYPPCLALHQLLLLQHSPRSVVPLSYRLHETNSSLHCQPL